MDDANTQVHRAAAKLAPAHDKKPVESAHAKANFGLAVSGARFVSTMHVTIKEPQVVILAPTAPDTIILSALTAISESTPNLIKQFQIAFDKRTERLGLSESANPPGALTEVMASLLCRTIPSRRASIPSIEEPVYIDPRFVTSLRSALLEVERTSPESMRWFNETVHSTHLTPREVLQQLLVLYVNSAATSPY